LATVYVVVKRAGRLHGQGPHLDNPEYRTALTWRRTELKALEDSVTEGLWRARQEKSMGLLDGQAGPSGREKTMVLLFRQQVVLLAMKQGRAPLPVSPALSRGLLRRGVLNDFYELGNIARRLSFLGDDRMLLAELKVRTGTKSPVREALSKPSETATEDRP
jgi:hypothetical protein